MTANRTKKGVFVAYSFIDSARNLVNKIKKDGYEIELKTVAQLKKETDKRQSDKVSIAEERMRKERIQKAREITPKGKKHKTLRSISKK